MLNESDRAWHIEQVRTTCRCTAAEPEKRVILPHEELVLSATIRIANEPGRTIRQIIEVYGDDPRDEMVFEMVAIVKDRITVLPQPLRLSLRPGEYFEQQLILENYSDSDWTELTIVPRADSARQTPITVLNLVCETVGTAKGSRNPRQVWSAVVKIDSAGLDFGAHQLPLDITATSAAGPPQSNVAQLQLEIQPEVRLVPQTIVFFPARNSDEASSKSAVLRYASRDLVPDPDRIEYSHDLPCDLSIRFASPPDTKLTIVTISIPPQLDASGSIKGNIVFSLPEPLNARLTLPVTILGTN